MTVRTFTMTVCVAALAGVALAQPPAAAPTPRGDAPRPAVEQQPTPTPSAPSPAIAPRRQGQPVNVKVEVTITDQRGGSPAMKKTVTVVTADGMGGLIRSTANYRGDLGDVPLNVDTEPELLTDGKIRLRVNLQYDLPGSVTGDKDSPGGGVLRRTQIRENLAVILETGKSITVAQSADPVGDRQVTIDVKATILR